MSQLFLSETVESVRVNIGMPVVYTDGRSFGRSLGRSVGQVITKFSGMGRFIYPWCSAKILLNWVNDEIS